MTDTAKPTRARKAPTKAANTTPAKPKAARKPKAVAAVVRALDPFRRDLMAGVSTNAVAFAIA